MWLGATARVLVVFYRRSRLTVVFFGARRANHEPDTLQVHIGFLHPEMAVPPSIAEFA